MKSVTTSDRPVRRRGGIGDSRLGTLVVLGVTTVLVMVGAYLVNRPEAAAGGVTAVRLTGARGAAPVVGRAAQDFTATTVDGQKISLSGYRGHPVWLTFGASWCAACRAEAPDIEAAYQRAKAGGLVVLEVFMSEDAGTVRGYAGRVGLSYVKVADPDTRIASAYRVLGIPVHFFIDRSGVLRLVKTGSLTGPRMDAALAAINR